MGLFELLTGDPTQQIAARLGQGPGQPGSPQGPQPLAPPPGPQGGGPQQQQQQQQAPQGPQVYQSPPDLAQMYLQLSQHEAARQQFNSGLGLIAASAYPGRNPGAIMRAMSAGEQDPGALFNNFMQLQQMQRQQQTLNAFQQGLPKMLSDAGLSQDYAPLVMANPNLLGDIIKSRMGLTGDPAERALQAARNDWLMRNLGKTEADMLKEHPEYSDPISYAATKTGEATTAAATAKDQTNDRNSAQKSLPSLVTTTGDMLTNLDKIIGASDDDLSSYVGGPIAALKPLTGPGASMTANPELAASLDQVVKQTFGEGFREVAGKTSRVTNTEATSLSGSLSQLQNRGLSPAEFRTQAQIVKDRLLHTLGTAYGEAGQSDNLPDYLKGNDTAGNPYLDSEYSPKGSRYWQSGGTAPPGRYPGLASAAPSSNSGSGPVDLRNSKDPDGDYAKLPSGATFIAPDGQQRRKP